MSPHVPHTILALSGSLKHSSVNSAVLRTAAAAGVRNGTFVAIGDSVRKLPHFDPDLEAAPPEAVLRFRAACERAAGVLLSVPEYAFGIPGSFKNALDWTVGSGCLYRKPVTLINVAPPGRGQHVRASLELVFQALDADVVYYALPLAPSDRDPRGEVSDPRFIAELRAVVGELVDRARRRVC